MAAGATAALSSILSIWIGYIAPSMIPISVRLGLGGQEIDLSQAAMLGTFTVALYVLARSGHRGFVEATRSRHQATALAAQLEQSRLKLAQAINSIPDGFVLFDGADRIVTYNDPYRALYPEFTHLLFPRIKSF